MSGGVTSAATGGGFVAKAGLHAVSALAYAAGRGGAPACLFVGAGRDVTAHAAVSLLAIGRAHVADAGCIVHSIAAAEGGDDEVTELIVCAHHLAVFVRVTPGSESLHAPAAGAPASAAPVIMTCARLVDAGDWILDATWGMCGGPQRIALLALARNSVLVVCVGGAGHGAVRARLSQSGDSLGALFCARVHEGWCSGGITVAAGTFRGVINVWKTTSAASGAHPEVIAAASASLCGHKGLVTALAWGRDGASVLSGSDDRTVRMWTRRTDTTEAALARACCDVPCDSVAAHVTHDWRHLWTAFGHSGRVWSTAFSPMCTASCGEDGSVYLWSYSGISVAKMDVFGCHELRCLTASGDVLFAGGDDSMVHAWPLGDGCRRGVHDVIVARIAPEVVLEAKISLAVAPPHAEYVRKLRVVGTRGVVAVMKSGAVHWISTSGSCELLLSAAAAGMCSACVSACVCETGRHAVLCDAAGTATLLELFLPGGAGDTHSQGPRGRVQLRVPAADGHGGPPSACFVADCCGAGGRTVVCSAVGGSGTLSLSVVAPAVADSESIVVHGRALASIRRRGRAVASCVAAHADLGVVFVGDSAGDVAVFELPGLFRDGGYGSCSLEPQSPSFVAACVHGIDQVVCVTVVAPTVLVSAGMDGQVIEFEIVGARDPRHWGCGVGGVDARVHHNTLDQGRPLMLSAAGVGCVRLIKRGAVHPPLMRTVHRIGWMPRIGSVPWSASGGPRMWVAGTTGDGLSIQSHDGHARVSLADLPLDSGAWRLEKDVGVDAGGGFAVATLMPREALVAAIQLVAWRPRLDPHRSGGQRFHSRTCTGVAWCGGLDGGGHQLMATGGEDNKVQLLAVACGGGGDYAVTTIGVLDGHLAAVRSVAASSREGSGSEQLLVTGGGLNSSLCWAVDTAGRCRWVGSCRMPVGDVDQRVTCVVVLPPCGTAGGPDTAHIVVSVTSGGCACIHVVDTDLGTARLAASWVASPSAVLSASAALVGDNLYVALGDSAGCVLVFGHSVWNIWKRSDGVLTAPKVLFGERVHAAGVNAVLSSTFEHVSAESSTESQLRVLSVGDDQAIALVLVSLNTPVSVAWRWAGVSSSLLRGASVCAGVLFTCGADQRLEVWRVHVSKSSAAKETDPSCLSGTRLGAWGEAELIERSHSLTAVLWRCGSALVEVGDVHGVAAQSSPWCASRAHASPSALYC